jgi:hypothetical protein
LAGRNRVSVSYVDNARSLGKLLLLARRLCERGCGFVTVTTNFVWDMHADQNNATMTEGMGYMAPPLDHAVSAGRLLGLRQLQNSPDGQMTE